MWPAESVVECGRRTAPYRSHCLISFCSSHRLRRLTLKIPPTTSQAGMGTTKKSRNWVVGNMAAKKADLVSGLSRRERDGWGLTYTCKSR